MGGDSGRLWLWVYILFSTFVPNVHPQIIMEKGNPSSAGSSYNDTTPVDLFSDETVDTVYQAKAHVLNQAIQEIGMGKYQVRSCPIN